MAFSESGAFTSPQTATHIKVHRCRFHVFSPLVDTTGSGDTSPEYTVAGFEQSAGVFNGWMVSTASSELWTTISGTLTLNMTNAADLSFTAQVFRLEADMNYGANGRLLIPLSCRFRSSSLITYSGP